MNDLPFMKNGLLNNEPFVGVQENEQNAQRIYGGPQHLLCVQLNENDLVCEQNVKRGRKRKFNKYTALTNGDNIEENCDVDEQQIIEPTHIHNSNVTLVPIMTRYRKRMLENGNQLGESTLQLNGNEHPANNDAARLQVRKRIVLTSRRDHIRKRKSNKKQLNSDEINSRNEETPIENGKPSADEATTSDAPINSYNEEAVQSDEAVVEENAGLMENCERIFSKTDKSFNFNENNREITECQRDFNEFMQEILHTPKDIGSHSDNNMINIAVDGKVNDKEEKNEFSHNLQHQVRSDKHCANIRSMESDAHKQEVTSTLHSNEQHVPSNEPIAYQLMTQSTLISICTNYETTDPQANILGAPLKLSNEDHHSSEEQHSALTENGAAVNNPNEIMTERPLKIDSPADGLLHDNQSRIDKQIGTEDACNEKEINTGRPKARTRMGRMPVTIFNRRVGCNRTRGSLQCEEFVCVKNQLKKNNCKGEDSFEVSARPRKQQVRGRGRQRLKIGGNQSEGNQCREQAEKAPNIPSQCEKNIAPKKPKRKSRGDEEFDQIIRNAKRYLLEHPGSVDVNNSTLMSQKCVRDSMPRDRETYISQRVVALVSEEVLKDECRSKLFKEYVNKLNSFHSKNINSELSDPESREKLSQCLEQLLDEIDVNSDCDGD